MGYTVLSIKSECSSCSECSSPSNLNVAHALKPEDTRSVLIYKRYEYGDGKQRAISDPQEVPHPTGKELQSLCEPEGTLIFG